ncbi:MAG TPA: 4,5-DOPA dioxygenase extradiol [Candidatus Baltobacteraceae bacterium]|nr:4,5-DOPA dioxygenase extradiol [Candidatus Baltobacteraceae bacterium]
MEPLMPAVFVGHGNPMLTLGDNEYTHAWHSLGAALPRPRAILCVSAHWYGPGTAVTAMPAPRTIHDFGGFPQALHEVQYPAPGDPVLARQVSALLAPVPVGLDARWGLDHGTWTVLRHAFPDAKVPVLQLKLDATQAPAWHYAVGQRLAPLREQGVLIVGSGNLVHNFQHYAWGQPRAPLDWAVRFETTARTAILEGNNAALIEYDTLGDDARLAIPTPDHYLPLLYVLAVRTAADRFTFPVEGIEGGSMSMLAVRVG